MPSPEFQLIMQRLAKVGPAYMDAIYVKRDISLARQLMKEIASGDPLAKGVAVIPVNAAGVTCEWLVPEGAIDGRRLAWLHGGSYLAGDLEMFRPMISHLAKAAGIAVLNVDYALAPEHTLHDARADAVAAFSWMIANGPDGPGIADRAFLGGDSAGGSLSISAAQEMLRTGMRSPDAIVSLGGAVDLADLSGIPPEAIAYINYVVALFLQDLEVTDPLASPINGPLAGLPPMLLQVSAVEPALESNVHFHEHARAAGVAADISIWPDMPHDWGLFAGQLPEADAALAEVGAYLRAR